MLGRNRVRDKFGLGYGLSPEIIVDPHLLTAGTLVGVWSQQARKGRTVAAETGWAETPLAKGAALHGISRHV